MHSKFTHGAVAALVIGAGVGALLTVDYAAYLGRLAERGLEGAPSTRDGTPTIVEIHEAVTKLNRAHEAFKETNDAALEEIRKNGVIDPVTLDKLEKLERSVEEWQGHKTLLESLRDDLTAMQTKLNRPSGGTGADGDGYYDEDREHVRAFNNWLQHSDDQRALTSMQEAAAAVGQVDQQRAVLMGTDAAGGYAVPKIIADQVGMKAQDFSPMRQFARVVQAGSSDYHELIDVGGEAGGWVGESDTRSETGTAQLADCVPTFGISYAYPKISEEALQDVFFDGEAWLIEASGRTLGIQEGAAFMAGNGTKKPTGLISGTPNTIGDEDSPARAYQTVQYIPSGAAGAFAPDMLGSPAGNPLDAFHDTIAELKSAYRANARWAMARATAGLVRKFKDADGNYVWVPGATAGQPAALLGYPVVEDEEVPAVAANSFSVVFGDFREAYLIVDLSGLRITRDEITTPGFVKFYVRRRLGGNIRNDDAVKFIKMAAS